MDMDCHKFIKEILPYLDCKYILDSYAIGWKRIFILTSSNVQIGRIKFHNNSLYSIKNYKKIYWQSLEFDETDFIFCQLHWKLSKNIQIKRTEFKTLFNEALEIRKKDLENKAQWRRNNPKENSRPKLQGKNPMFIIEQLLTEKYSTPPHIKS